MLDLDKLLRHGVPLFAGVAMLIGAAWASRREADEAAHWVEVRTKIVSVVRERDGDRWAPVVELDVGGKSVRATGSYSSSEPAKGSEVVVRYDPAAPEQTMRVLESFEGLVPAALVVLGVGGVLTGLLGFWRDRKRSG